MTCTAWLRTGSAAIFLLSSSLIPAASAREADEIVLVTAARTPIPAEDATASVTVLDEADIEARDTGFIADMLRTVPGLAVSRSGAGGQLTQIRLRGSEANHVLVLIDGVEAASPFTGEADFAHLNFDDLTRIEVARGEQSALWGPDAIGGVIRLTSAGAPGQREATARIEAGDFGALRASGRIAFPFEHGWASASAGAMESDGIDVSATGGAADAYASRTVALAGALEVSDRWRVEATGRWIAAEADFDSDTDFDGRLDDADLARRSDQLLTRLALMGEQGRFSHRTEVHLTDELAETFAASLRTGRNIGQRRRAFHQTTARWDGDGVAHRLTGLAEWESDRLKNDSGAATEQSRVIDTVALALDYGLEAGRWDAAISVRVEDNDGFAGAATWRAGLGRAFDGLNGRLHGAIGAGVKNPGLFELFGYFPDSFVGNRDLQPEDSIGWEIGWTQSHAWAYGAELSWSATWFQSELEHEIYTDFGVFPATARNRSGGSERSGLEVSGRWSGGDVSIFGSAAVLQSEADGAPEIRRPERLASLTFAWRPDGGPLHASISADHTGEQLDTDFGSYQIVALDAYTLVSGRIAWRLADRAEIYVRGENLTDEIYEDVFGYRSAGRGLYLGLRLGR